MERVLQRTPRRFIGTLMMLANLTHFLPLVQRYLPRPPRAANWQTAQPRRPRHILCSLRWWVPGSL